jgi:hypothetical protein
MSMQGIDETLVLEFLRTFSRFEYALKRSGYCRPNRELAEADWDTLENDITRLSASELAAALDSGSYIRVNPPKKQIVKDGKLAWAFSTPTASDIKTLVIYVRRVRNNLFHGKKLPQGPEEEVARNRQLIEGATAVLKALLNLPGLPPGIKASFEAAA